MATSPRLPETFVDIEENPREYFLNALTTVVDIHTRVSDLFSSPHDQIKDQLRLTIETVKERQERELINNPDYGLLANVDAGQRISTLAGAPTPDDLDNLLTKVWKEPAFFLAHPLAIAAFGREATRRGVPPPTVSLFGSQFITWRGVPLIPSDKVPVVDGKTSILLLRVGESRQGVVALYQPGLVGEQGLGLSVRFMGINRSAIASYLVSLYFSLAVLTEDALAVLEGVEIGKFHDYADTYKKSRIGTGGHRPWRLPDEAWLTRLAAEAVAALRARRRPRYRAAAVPLCTGLCVRPLAGGARAGDAFRHYARTVLCHRRPLSRIYSGVAWGRCAHRPVGGPVGPTASAGTGRTHGQRADALLFSRPLCRPHHRAIGSSIGGTIDRGRRGRRPSGFRCPGRAP